MNCRFLNLVPTDYGLVLKNICNPSSIVVENSQVSLGVNVCTCVCAREREREDAGRRCAKVERRGSCMP